jgi:hypothetical protein
MIKESWSRKYYPGLPDYQHEANDEWFRMSLELLTATGTLIVPSLGLAFNRKGECITKSKES